MDSPRLKDREEAAASLAAAWKDLTELAAKDDAPKMHRKAMANE